MRSPDTTLWRIVDERRGWLRGVHAAHTKAFAAITEEFELSAKVERATMIARLNAVVAELLCLEEDCDDNDTSRASAEPNRDRAIGNPYAARTFRKPLGKIGP